MNLLGLLKRKVDDKVIRGALDSLEKMRDFHIIVDCLEKFMTEMRKKELRSREIKLRGYNRCWEEGLQRQID
jgi:hypothetical protein